MFPFTLHVTAHSTLEDEEPNSANSFYSEPPPMENRSSSEEPISRMPVRVGDRVVLLSLRDIFWIQSKGNWICLHSCDAQYECRMTMVDILRKLDPAGFLRVHRNAIVNLTHVLEFSLPRAGNAFVHLRNGTALPISKTGRSALRKYLLSAVTPRSRPPLVSSGSHAVIDVS